MEGIAYKVVNRHNAWVGIEVDPDTAEELDVITPRHRNSGAGRKAAVRDCKRWRKKWADLLGNGGAR